MNKIIAYALGITCHVSFMTAIAAMAYMLFEGLTVGIFPLGQSGRVFNVVLLVQFPILHSFLLSQKGKRILEMPFPREIAKDLSTTSFSLLSSLQLLLVFLFWTPDREVWFAPSGELLVLWTLVYVTAWVLLVIALYEAGMAMHTGALGWRAVVRGEKPEYPKLCKAGLHKQCRHPIYFAFSLIILTAPVWSFDHLALSVIWVAYCLIGPLFKEQRLKRYFKDDFQKHREGTPYFLPKFFLVRSKQAGKLKG